MMQKPILPVLTEEEAKDQVMSILLDIFYDRQSIKWDELKEKALILYKYNSYGPKGTKNVALYLYKLYQYIEKEYLKWNAKYKKYVDKNKGKEIKPQVLYVDSKGNPLSLGEMDSHGHLSIYNEVARLSGKMRSYINDIKFFEYCIWRNYMQIYQRLVKIKDENIITVFQEKYIEQIENQNTDASTIVQYLCNSKLAPEDLYRRIKEVNLFLDTYQANHQQNLKKQVTREAIENFFNNDDQKELETQAYELLDKMNALYDKLEDDNAKACLSIDILEFEMIINEENTYAIQKEMTRFRSIYDVEKNLTR